MTIQRELRKVCSPSGAWFVWLNRSRTGATIDWVVRDECPTGQIEVALAVLMASARPARWN